MEQFWCLYTRSHEILGLELRFVTKIKTSSQYIPPDVENKERTG